MSTKRIISILFLCLFLKNHAQILEKNPLFTDFFKVKTFDSTAFISYRKKHIFLSDLTFINAPFSIFFKDSLGNNEKLQFRNNIRPVIGFGYYYKWIALRIAFNLPVSALPYDNYGETNYIDLGFEFKTKKSYFDIDFHNYRGYVQKNAYQQLTIDSIDASNPHLQLKQMNAASLSVNFWKFRNKNIDLYVLRGKRGLYNSKQSSFYIKNTYNLHGVLDNSGLIHEQFRYAENSKTSARGINAFDFGFIPGFVHVNRINNFQYAGMIGFGPVLQIKTYFTDQVQRQFIGLAPRYDIRILFGYNTPKYFLNVITEFDNKSIKFNDLKYRQSFYQIRITGGIRLLNDKLYK